MIMTPEYPYVVLVNVGVTDLEPLREKAREAARKCASRHDDDVMNEAFLFRFESNAATWMFEVYCYRNRIPYRRV